MRSTPVTQLLDAALAFALRGWHVFPVEPGGKSPIGHLVPQGKDNASRDEAQIRHWWGIVPNANIGIAVGPSGLIVLDIDVADGKQGRASFASLQPQLTDTLIAETGSGGFHAYYARNDLEPFQRIGALPGVDLIGKGYVIAPPSLHSSGKQYSWANQASVAAIPAVLVGLRKEVAPQTVSTSGTPIEKGGRNNALFALGCALRSQGIGRDALRGALHLENRARFTPPLEEAEVELVVSSVMTRVHPQRDAALGAVVEEEFKALFAGEIPESVAMWIHDVALKPSPPVRTYSTGNPQLDGLLGGGVSTTQVCGVIGPPSVGKSAYIGSMCWMIQREIPVLHISTELTRRELMIRYAALVAQFPWRDGMKGKHDAALGEATNGLRIKMIGADTLDTADPIGMIVREALALIQEFKVPPLIVIDYVQLLARGTDDGIKNRVSDLSKRIRIMAQILDCAVLAVFTTNRGFYGSDRLEKMRALKDPTAYLGAAKESGDIEFDCATILFLDVDQTADGTTKPACAIVARCRFGDIGFAGYRANLARGLWTPDPLAYAEMSKESKKEKDHVEQNEEDELKVLACITQHPGVAWRVLRNEVLHIKHDRADAAKKRLIESGKLTVAAGMDENMRPFKGLVAK